MMWQDGAMLYFVVLATVMFRPGVAIEGFVIFACGVFAAAASAHLGMFK